ncbi:MAG: hypothetical protein J6K15_02435 [Lachnospiraceae bacterium]|nr:hypothetical protein [Lachnospiraceae bacterium]
MAKTIKFNLCMDGYPARTLEDVQEHFSVEDILKYYKEGSLLRWLEVREYDREARAVKGISEEADNKEILKQLINIFDVETEEKEVENALRIFDYNEKERQIQLSIEKNKVSRTEMIAHYFEGYKNLLNKMVENKEDFPMLKRLASTLEQEYSNLFAYDFDGVFYKLRNEAPKAVYAILTRQALRELWMAPTVHEVENKVGKLIKSEFTNWNEARKILGEDFRMFKGTAWQSWEQAVEKNTKVLVLRVAEYTEVRSKDSTEDIYNYQRVKNELPILNGLECFRNNKDKVSQVAYVEV